MNVFSVPHIEESLYALLGVQWFRVMDWTSGYKQILVMDSKHPKTAFNTPFFGLFEFNQMPFGLCNAPKTLERPIGRMFNN